jgi:YD repeat-containing protein
VRIAKLLAILLLTASFAFGQASPTQVAPSNDTGVKPYQTYAGARENINLSNGNLSLDIPLLALPGRGLGLNLSVQYNSKIWSPHATWGSGSDLIYHWQYENANIGQLGWNLNIPTIFQGNVLTDENGNPAGLTDYIVSLPSGGKTSFAVPPYSSNFSMDSEDGTFSRIYVSGSTASVKLKDGTVINFPCLNGCIASSIVDSNGNQISYSGSASNLTITDTTGRQTTVVTTTISGGETITVNYKDSNGSNKTITLNVAGQNLFATHSFSQPQTHTCTTCHFNTWVYQPGSGSYLMLSSIALPDGLGTYSFAYDDYGNLTTITYPTGGYTNYEYQIVQHGETFWQDAAWNISSDFPEIAKRRVCSKASCTPDADDDVTTYSPGIGSTSANNSGMAVQHFIGTASNQVSELTSYQFTNTDVSNNDTKWHQPREISRSIYNSAGTLLRTITTDYNQIESVSGYYDYLPIRVTTTLNDVSPVLVTKTETAYDSYTATVLWPYPGQDYTLQAATARTRYIDNPLQTTTYDYGSGAAGSLLRTTNNTWDKASGSIWEHPLTEETLDGTGTRIAYTTYEYDNYTEGLSASGATQLLSSARRGNQTAVSHWRNSDGGMLTTRRQYDDAGNVRKITDPAGHWTTFSFADNWSGGNSACAPGNGQAAAYPTLVQNQLGHQTHSAYNSCTGTVAAATDANSQTTTTTYDALNRPVTVVSPDGGMTQFTYADPNHTTVQKKPAVGINDPSLWATTHTLYDGIGRTVQVASANGESGSGWDVKTTCYDTRGFPYFTSYPAQMSSVPSTASCSLPGDTLQYDALGRVAQVTHSDGPS